MPDPGRARFDTVLMLDWSGGNDRGPGPVRDAIWAGLVRGRAEAAPVYLRNRQVAEDWLTHTIAAERARGRRVLAGFDFPFGYPAGFAAALTGRADALALWDWFEARVRDAPKANNRFDLAGAINARLPGTGPFWGNALTRDIAHLPRRGRVRGGHGLPEFRAAETRAPGTFSCWQLAGAGAVGSQVIMGLPVLARLRRRFHAAAWPFEPWQDAPLVLAEIWPGLIRPAVRAAADPIPDRAQVRLLARAFARLAPGRLAAMLRVDAPEEGWILGLGHESDLADAAGAPA